jgi:hypothetical protein
MTTAVQIIGVVTGLAGLILGTGVIWVWIQDVRGKKAKGRQILTKIEEGSLGIWKSDRRCWSPCPRLRCWITLDDVKLPNQISTGATPGSIQYTTDDQNLHTGWVGMLSLIRRSKVIIMENMESPNSLTEEGFEMKISWKNFFAILIFTGITEIEGGIWPGSTGEEEKGKISGKLGFLHLSKKAEGPIVAHFEAANRVPLTVELNLKGGLPEYEAEPPINTSDIIYRVLGVHKYNGGKICLAEINFGIASATEYVQLISNPDEWMRTELFRRFKDLLGVPPERDIRCMSIAGRPRNGLGENWFEWEGDMLAEGYVNGYQSNRDIRVDRDCLLAIADAWYHLEATGYGVVARGRIVNDIIQRISRPYADLVLLWCGQCGSMGKVTNRRLVREVIESDLIVGASLGFGHLVNAMTEMIDKRQRDIAVCVLKTLLTEPSKRNVMCDVLREFINSEIPRINRFKIEGDSNMLRFGEESIDGLPGSGPFIEEDLLTYLSVSEVKRIWLTTTNNSSALQHLPKTNYLVR